MIFLTIAGSMTHHQEKPQSKALSPTKHSDTTIGMYVYRLGPQLMVGTTWSFIDGG
jgi:hypothetical protein